MGRLTRIAAVIGSVIASVPATAVTRVVDSCQDSGPGSLRSQIAAANDGDVIDLSTNQLTCSTITLTSGQIPVTAGITLHGPASRVTVTNSPALPPGPYRLLNVGPKGITIENLAFVGGYYFTRSGSAKGGCIYSQAKVKLINSSVSGCTAYSYSGAVAKGGGIFASSTYVLLDHSTVTGNSAVNYLGAARGGGISTGILHAYYSTISGNVATSRTAAGSGAGVGGGVYTQTSNYSLATSIIDSTVDSNFAQRGGGLYVNDPFHYTSCNVLGSTISGNRATEKFGGLYCSMHMMTVSNSTIAFNTAMNYAGIYAFTESSTVSSSIVARNVNAAGAGFADLFQIGSGKVWSCYDCIVTSYSPVPSNGPVTITGDPQLAPLAYHGGLTRTHALLASSPAIDKGNNGQSLSFDQRGAGFPREVPSGKPDIGAYERQVDDDELYYNGFQ